MSVAASAKGGSAAKKPETQLIHMTAYALVFAVGLVLLARTQLSHNLRASPLCEGSSNASCSMSSSLRGAQNLLREAVRQLARQRLDEQQLAAAQQLAAHEADSSEMEDATFDQEGADEVTEAEHQAQLQQQQQEADDEEEGEDKVTEEEELEGEDEMAAGGEQRGSEASVGPAEAAGQEEGGTSEQQHISADSTEENAEEEEELLEAATRTKGKEKKKEEEKRKGGNRGAQDASYMKALEGCTDLACVSEAAGLDLCPGQFRFPSFYIVGWQKCATTSLFFHLRGHPQVLLSKEKEPEFFSCDCEYDPTQCSKNAQKEYLLETMKLEEALDADLQVAAVEASTHYGRYGHHLAAKLHDVFPWLKIVVSLREPISRAISMLAHNLDKHDLGCLTEKAVFPCLERSLKKENYSRPLQAWLEAYPAGQVYLIQYENITSGANQSHVLHSVKNYLGIDPELPNSDLGLRNTRESHLMDKGELKEGEEAEGWPMTRDQYQALIDLVRPDARKVAELAEQYGLANGQEWLQNWEKEWQATLGECKEDGSCNVVPN